MESPGTMKVDVIQVPLLGEVNTLMFASLLLICLIFIILDEVDSFAPQVGHEL